MKARANQIAEPGIYKLCDDEHVMRRRMDMQVKVDEGAGGVLWAELVDGYQAEKRGHRSTRVRSFVARSDYFFKPVKDLDPTLHVVMSMVNDEPVLRPLGLGRSAASRQSELRRNDQIRLRLRR